MKKLFKKKEGQKMKKLFKVVLGLILIVALVVVLILVGVLFYNGKIGTVQNSKPDVAVQKTRPVKKVAKRMSIEKDAGKEIEIARLKAEIEKVKENNRLAAEKELAEKKVKMKMETENKIAAEKIQTEKEKKEAEEKRIKAEKETIKEEMIKGEGLLEETLQPEEIANLNAQTRAKIEKELLELENTPIFLNRIFVLRHILDQKGLNKELNLLLRKRGVRFSYQVDKIIGIGVFGYNNKEEKKYFLKFELDVPGIYNPQIMINLNQNIFTINNGEYKDINDLIDTINSIIRSRS